MSRKVLTSLIAICASATVFASQAPAPGSQTPAPRTTSPQPAPSAAAKADSVTLEGCIERSAANPSATPGAIGTAGSSTSSFMLSNAAKPMGATGAAGSAGGTVGTAGRPSADTPSASIASTYRLDGDNSKLTPHVGHKVEVTGSIQASSTNPITAPSASVGTATGAPTFKVESVKMLASSCTP